MDNAVLQCIRTRRSVRKFKDEQITPEELDALLEAAIWAPSGDNSQRWLFTAIQNRKVLETLNIAIRNAVLTSQSALAQRLKFGALQGQKEYFFRAPTIIIAANDACYLNAMEDCALGLENIMLAAHSIGLGTCWVNALRRVNDEDIIAEVLTEIGIPRGYIICGTLAVGYPDEQPAIPARKDGTTLIMR